MTRPSTIAGSTCATPDSATMIDLMGGDTYSGVSFSRDEIGKLEAAYGYDFKSAEKEARDFERAAHARAVAAYEVALAKADRWGRPTPPNPPDLDGMPAFVRSGALLQLFRHIECDGLRVMAALAPHLERDEDPVRLVLRGLVAMGFDVMVDPDWIDGGGDE